MAVQKVIQKMLYVSDFIVFSPVRPPIGRHAGQPRRRPRVERALGVVLSQSESELSKSAPAQAWA